MLTNPTFDFFIVQFFYSFLNGAMNKGYLLFTLHRLFQNELWNLTISFTYAMNFLSTYFIDKPPLEEFFCAGLLFRAFDLV